MPVLLMMLFILLVVLDRAPSGPSSSRSRVYNGAIIGEALRSGIARPAARPARGGARHRAHARCRRGCSIEFPQAFRQMLPIIVAQLVVLLKDTALGYIVGYVELTTQGLNYLAASYGSRVHCSRSSS